MGVVWLGLLLLNMCVVWFGLLLLNMGVVWLGLLLFKSEAPPIFQAWWSDCSCFSLFPLKKLDLNSLFYVKDPLRLDYFDATAQLIFSKCSPLHLFLSPIIISLQVLDLTS
jgi:hypothetical protein